MGLFKMEKETSGKGKAGRGKPAGEVSDFKETKEFKEPKEGCRDIKCPFHGGLGIKKETFVGKVIKKDLNRSATIEWFWPLLVPKYERFETRRVRLRVHNPACINAQPGDKVKVARTRPLSKTKHHVIIQILFEKLSKKELAAEGEGTGREERMIKEEKVRKKQ